MTESAITREIEIERFLMLSYYWKNWFYVFDFLLFIMLGRDGKIGRV